MRARALAGLLALVALAGSALACTPASSGSELRLGYFPNMTHATALVGVARGLFADQLGAHITLSTQTFNDGPSAVEGLLTGALDAAYLGPSPSINAYAQTDGQAIRVVAGATSGGASLVVRPGIDSPADLRGARIATPQLGNTQDVALRAWLLEHGLTPSGATSPGDVRVEPTDNPTTLTEFSQGRLDGAWVPEPWASRLVLRAGASVLLDERDLWPAGRFVTTHLVVRADYLREHPRTVRSLIAGELDTNAWIAENPEQAKDTINSELDRLAGGRLPDEVLDRAFDQITVTADPIASSLATSAEHATAAGLLDPVDLTGIYDLTQLRAARSDWDRPDVDPTGPEESGP